MELFGYIGAILMGLSLGLIGGGGSILTVPLLVYLFAIDTVLATTYSLFIVGLTSAIGSVSHIKQGNIHWQTVLVFGLPSIVSVSLTRLFLVPIIPNQVAKIGGTEITKPVFLLIVFASLMLAAAYSMIRKSETCKDDYEEKPVAYNYPLILVEGLVVGVVSGLVGAGGGFLIIPALVVLANIPMKKAIGTSLIIIAIKSAAGFLGDLNVVKYINWSFLFFFTAAAVVGIITGSRLSKKISSQKLKPAFGYFILVMGLGIIMKELFLK